MVFFFPTYFCFFKSSGLLLLLLEPTLDLVRVLPLDPRLSSVRVAAANLVFEPGFGYQTAARMRTLPMFWIR
jgi:hypothetical protein